MRFLPLRSVFPLLLFAAGCAGTSPKDPLVGTWRMTSYMQDNPVEATMTLERDDDGALMGNWSSRGSDMELRGVVAEGAAIQFQREIPGGQLLHFTGMIEGEGIEGSWSGSFGEIPVEGSRVPDNESPEPVTAFHERPIIERDGQTLLWANDEEWFDVTASKIDPATFQYGIGKDTIPSIDAPEFVRFEDPRVASAEITRETSVLGVVIGGEARAYPVELMDSHEVVNDNFQGEAYAILW